MIMFFLILVYPNTEDETINFVLLLFIVVKMYNYIFCAILKDKIVFKEH